MTGLTGLIGWVFGIPWIKSVVPGAVEMKANTAVCLLFSGVSVCLLDAPPSRRSRQVGQSLALATALIGLLTSAEYVFGWQLGLDEFLFHDTTDAYNSIRGRMSPYSAAVFTIIGLGLASAPCVSLRWMTWLAATLTLLIGGVSFVGYLWNASELVTDRFLPPVAVNTAAAFLFLGVGTLAAIRTPTGQIRTTFTSISRVEKQTLTGFLATLFLLVLSGGYSYRAAVQTVSAVQRVGHTQQVRNELARLYSAISDAESQQRSYLLTTNIDYREDYKRDLVMAREKVQALAHLVADNPEQVQRQKKLQDAVGNHLIVLDRNTVTFEEAGLAKAQEMIATGVGRKHLESIRSLIKRMDSVEEELLTARETSYSRNRATTLLCLLLMLAAAVAGFLVLFSGIRREIAIRTQAETALRGSEEDLAVTLYSIGDAVLATDSQRRITRLNPVAQKLTGWTQSEASGRFVDEVFRIINEESRDLVINPVDAVLATGEIQGLANHTILIARDGTEYAIADSAAPIRDGRGSILGVVLVFRDVSAERAAEKALRESEVRYRTLFDSIDEGFCIIEMIFDEQQRPVDYRFLVINPSFERQTGLRDALGKRMRELVPHHESHWFEIYGQIAVTGEAARFQSSAEQLQRAFDVYAFRFGEPKDRQVAILFSDITQRKHAEESLRRSEENLAVTLNSIGDAVLATDVHRRITRLNPAAEKLTGWTQAEASGRFVDEVFHIVNEETRQPAGIPVDSVLETGEIHGLANHTVLIGRDGTECPIADSAAPIRDVDGRILGVVLVFRDVTEARRYERELQRFNTELERKVAERTKQLVEKERFNQATLDALSAHIAVLDSDGSIIATNQTWTRFSRDNGASHQLVGERANYLEACDRAAANGDADAADAAAAIRQVIAGKQGTWVHEYPCHSPDEQRWFYCRVTRFPGDGAVPVVVAHENITVMKQAQEQLAAVRSRFETLDRVSPVAIMFFDGEGHCIDVNDRWREISGVSRETARGDGWQLVVHPDDRARVSHEWHKATHDGEFFSSEYRILRPNGTFLWLVSQGVPVRDAKGAISGFVGVSTDVTEQKRTEQALRLLSTDLVTLRGVAFYEAVVHRLAELLNCEIAFVSRPDPVQPDRLFTLALVVDGEIQPNFNYPFEGTPCEQVRGGRSSIILSGAWEKYPHDTFLSDHRIEAFVGVPFIDSNGRQLGGIGVMSRHPLTNPGNLETITTLFGVSVAAEMTWQASERRFSDLFEYSPDAVVITNHNGVIIQANQQVATVFGWRPADLVGQAVEVLMPLELQTGHPSLRQRYLESALPRAMGSGRNDLLGLRKDGSVFPVDISLSPMQASEGLLVAAAVRDVSERRRSDEALREAKEFSDTVIETVSGLFYVIAKDGIFARWNQSMLDLLGLTADQMGRTHALTITHEADRELIAHKIAEVFASGQAETEARLLTANGPRLFLLNGRRLDVNQGAFLVGSGVDITDRSRMQDQLRRSEAQYRMLFESSRDAVLTLSPLSGRFTSGNPATILMFGVQDQRQFCSLGPVHLSPERQPDGRLSTEKAAEMIEVAMREGSVFFEFVHRRINGEVFPATVLLTRMELDGQSVLQATVRDITNEKRVLQNLESMATDLRAANALIEQERAQLADRVAARTTELTVANQELIRASRFKSEFLATMSHELRTPLNGVLGMNELLLKTPLNEKQREFVEACNTSGKSLLSLINDVLDISKIEAGKIELDIQSCELETLAYDVVAMFAHRAKLKGVSLSCRLDPESCVTALCDDNRMRQVLVNLLGNALKFTSTGSVILESKSVQRDEHRILVQFLVTDTGLGIPDDKLDRLFSPFSQVDRSTSRHYGGTGLGLSISKQLVELMGGTIGVKSRVGVGSTFWIEIPLQLMSGKVKVTQQREVLRGIRILAVDGVDKERRQIADCLDSWGCLFEQVRTLPEAVDAVSRAEADGSPYSVVLADCRLVASDEFLHLQNLAQRPNLPIIGLGVDATNDLESQLHRLGVHCHLRDPVQPSTLYNALASVLVVVSPPLLSVAQSGVSDDGPQATLSAHILVAEDNEINQMFVRELLAHCGCTCDIASNGDAALSSLQHNRYDLVLMDCQMPEMDGFTASREIRRREAAGELSGRLPIIALTANALKGDREKCLEAGMDDYLSKPLKAAKLQAALTRFLPILPADHNP